MIDEKMLKKDLLRWFSGKKQYCLNCGYYDLLNDFEDCFDAFEDIIEAQPKLDVPDNNVGKWTPCSQELPPKPDKFDEDSYIVQMEYIITPFSAYWDGKEWADEEGNTLKYIIAWMPLPEAYKGE